MDLDEVGERIKHTNTVQHAEGYMLLNKGMIHRSKSPTAAGRYFQIAIEKFQEALDSNSNSKVILRDCAQAMIYLYKVSG
jgi:predicted transcriptional regulator